MRVLFAGDAHLGGGEGDASRAASFARLVREEPADLVVYMGDVFDFWFEYGGAVTAAHLPVLAAMAERARVSESVYLRGNHDLWAGRHMASCGLRVTDEYRAVADGVPFVAVHGDTCAGDVGGGVTRTLMGNPLSVALYRLLPPGFGVGLARAVSRVSRVHSRNLRPSERFPRRALERAAGAALLVMGHLHAPLLVREGALTAVCMGDWLRLRTYAVLEDGVVRVLEEGGRVLAEAVLTPRESGAPRADERP